MPSVHDTDLAEKITPQDSASGPACENSPLPSSGFAYFGPYELDIQREKLYHDGSRINLAGNAMKVLLKLLERPNEVVARSELHRYLWPAAETVDTATETSLSALVGKVRKALGDRFATPIYIDTIEGAGYSFIGRVEFSEAPGLASGRKRLQPTPTVHETSDSHACGVASGRSIFCLATTTFIAATLLGSELTFTWLAGIGPRTVGGLLLVSLLLGTAVCMTLAGVGLVFLTAPSLRRAH